MFQIISLERLEALLESGREFTLLDVRDREEFEAGRLLGAVSLPLAQIREAPFHIPRDRPVIVYCSSGSRSLQASRELDRMGYQAYHVSGGFSRYRGKYAVRGTK